MTNLEKEIIERIKSQMKMKKTNQEKLAEYLGLKQYTISRMLSGKPFPTIDQLFTIANNLDCSISYLLGIQEESYTELSKQAAKVAHAYNNSNETIKTIIDRILDI